ncbi:MAG: hypothetical protein JWL96_1235 [Sphingomonas bacterium]|uniref:carotenoid oxygenase family protein n=1 Tax=Sphingomonas bacterium TaxID=1895847 RepID=UPI0026150A17|nr:carotenoid oxygenase family protein [Sphingomonas bacterium]MDB5709165.1 hypothetical protein [Sphingomonas bacterium]
MCRSTAFPHRLVAAAEHHPYLNGAWTPLHEEVTATGLQVIEGKIPDDLDGIYLRNTENQLHQPLGRYHPFDGDGMIHQCGFLVALIGLASIVGPDSHAFGLDFYLLGSAIYMLGLTALAIQFVRRRILVAAGWLWLVAAAAGAAFAATESVPTFIVSGVSLGLGYIAAARAILR